MDGRLKLIPALVFLAALVALPATAVAAHDANGWRVLRDDAARTFVLPRDVRPARTWHDSRSGLEFTRYQQFAGPAHVEGAQLTVVRRAGEALMVVGAHYPGVGAVNRVTLTPEQAEAEAGTEGVGAAGTTDQQTELRLDPHTKRLFYRVESSAPGIRTFHDIDAQTGAVLASWNGIHRASGMGTGVKGDRKSLLGSSAVSSADNLTRKVNGTWRMQSLDGRLRVHDARNSFDYYPGMPIMSDASKSAWKNDNDWKAPYQAAAVDAQFYAWLTDEYLLDEHDFDLVDPSCGYGAIRSVVHYRSIFGGSYDNAYWDGEFLVYGDGDGFTTWSYSAGQDVVTHELGHAVTECATGLIYEDQPGALNESFSDILATAAEWSIDEQTMTGCRREASQADCPDWWIGEDVVFDSALGYAFRNLADPELLGQPGHFDDFWPDPHDEDNGGVHVNSGIPNHAFYLQAAGGRNARCAGPTDNQADCDVLVPAIGTTDAAQIAFTAWSMLTEEASFCEARNDSVAATDLLFPGSSRHYVAVDLAWAAVGLSAAECQPVSGFAIAAEERSLAIAPGSSGQFQLDITGVPAGAVTFGSSNPAPLTAVGNATGVQVSVPADAPNGIYPLRLSGTDGSVTRFASVVVVVDDEPPSAAVQSVRVASSGSVSNAGLVPLTIGWATSDALTGVSGAALRHSTNGTSYSNISGPNAVHGPTTFSAAAGAHHFRVEATDGAGNDTTTAATLRTLTTAQEGSGTYSGSWSTLSGQPWVSTRYSKAKGAAVTFAFNGTDVAWISTFGPKRGKAKVFIDNVQVSVVDLFAGSTQERRIAFSAAGLAAGSHTLRIVVNGTSGRPRVDINAFVVLAP